MSLLILFFIVFILLSLSFVFGFKKIINPVNLIAIIHLLNVISSTSWGRDLRYIRLPLILIIVFFSLLSRKFKIPHKKEYFLLYFYFIINIIVSINSIDVLTSTVYCLWIIGSILLIIIGINENHRIEKNWNEIIFPIQVVSFILVTSTLLSGNLVYGIFNSSNLVSWSVIILFTSTISILANKKIYKFQSKKTNIYFGISIILSLSGLASSKRLTIPFILFALFILIFINYKMLQRFIIGALLVSLSIITLFYIIPTLNPNEFIGLGNFGNKFSYLIDGIQKAIRYRELAFIDNRFIIWKSVINYIVGNKLLLGLGFGYISNYATEGIYLMNSSNFITSIHNSLLQIFVESGIVGGLIILFFIILSIINIQRIKLEERNGFIVFFIIILLLSFIEGGLYPGSSLYIPFWLAIIYPFSRMDYK